MRSAVLILITDEYWKREYDCQLRRHAQEKERFQGVAWLDAAAKQVFRIRPSEAVGRQAHGGASLAYILNLSSMWRDMVLSPQKTCLCLQMF
jgi:hypothetical protein